jgi:hypothetical protein
LFVRLLHSEKQHCLVVRALAVLISDLAIASLKGAGCIGAFTLVPELSTQKLYRPNEHKVAGVSKAKVDVAGAKRMKIESRTDFEA